jgi:hypothetical protein
VDRATGELVGTKVREKDTLNKEFWEDILSSAEFQKYIVDNFQIGHAAMMQEKYVEVEDESDE